MQSCSIRLTFAKANVRIPAEGLGLLGKSSSCAQLIVRSGQSVLWRSLTYTEMYAQLHTEGLLTVRYGKID